MRKHASRIAISLLLGAVVALGLMNYRQGRVIQAQRHVILEMFEYIVSGCPTTNLN